MMSMQRNIHKFQKTFLMASTALTRPAAAFGAAALALGGGIAHAGDPAANTLPTGGNVVGGAATINQSGNRMDINQSTNRTVIDWRNFDIGKNAHVNFNQPGSNSIAANRVNGSADPTKIHGQLTANGHVWILNPNGVMFGASARVDVSGIVASTANINVDRFMAGDMRLHLQNGGSGSIINNGSITVREAGLAAFVAPHVANNGTIHARLGKVTLASGTAFTLDLAGDRLVEIGLGAEGGIVDQAGDVVAEGGIIEISAQQAGAVVDSIINVTGYTSAASAEVAGGEIILGGGEVNVAGTLDASGATGGGSIDVRGKTITTADTAVLKADAAENGDGGTIIAFADDKGTYAGSFSAKGGANGGDGGFVETSGKKVNIEEGIYVNTLAANGQAGNWTIDPDDLTVVDGASAGSWTDAESTVTNGTIEALMNTTGITLTANNSITVDAEIDTTAQVSSTTLALNDENSDDNLTINLNQAIRLGTNQSLTGEGTTVNVASTGLIQNGVDVAATDATVNVAAGTYAEALTINKNISVVGAGAGQTTLTPDANYTGSGAANAWMFVQEGVDFSLSNVAVDGDGFQINQALRSHGNTTISNVDFRNILGSSIYTGIAVQSFGGTVAGGAGNDSHGGGLSASHLTVTDSTFENIGRIGVLIKGTGSTADITGSTFTGKGAGDFLDYAIEIGAGGSADIIGNTISGNRGVASSDGSTSAGILITTYYGDPAVATIHDNVISDSTTAIAVGYDGSDTSDVTITENTFTGNDYGLNLTAASIQASLSQNTFNVGSGGAVASFDNSADASQIASSENTINLQDGALLANAGELAGDDGTIYLADGSYAGTLNIDHTGVSVSGESENGTTINGGVKINAHDPAGTVFDGVSLANFTVNAANGQIGIHAVSNNDGVYNTQNLSITDVTVNANNSHGIGLFDVDGATLTDVTVNGNGTSFAAIEGVGLNNLIIDGGNFNGANYGLNIFDAAGYQANGNVTLSNTVISGNSTQIRIASDDGILLNGQNSTRLNVANNQTGVWVQASNVSVSGFEIVGPFEGTNFTDVDWNAQGNSYGVRITGNVSNTTVDGNIIRDIRSGIWIGDPTSGAGATVTNNTIDNTKGAVLVYGSDLAAATGNQNGAEGNEWGFVLGLDDIDDSAVADATRQGELMAYSLANNEMSVFDRGYGVNNRTHIFVDDDTPVATEADDFDYGNGLGNERQPLPSLQAAVNGLVSGGWINVGDGTYTLGNTLDIAKSLTLTGTSEAGTIIDASGIGNKYAIQVEGDNVGLSNFTLIGSPFAGSASYGIKVQPDTGVASDRVLNFSISDVTVQDSYRTALDLHAVDGATINNFTAVNTAWGNGITLTDSANVDIMNSTTAGNVWGGLAIYQRNAYYDQQSDNITIDATNTFNEDNPVYAQQYTSASQQMGSNITIEGFSHIVTNPDTDGGNTIYAWFRRTLDDAIDTALAAPSAASSFVQGWNGSDSDDQFYVGSDGVTSMSIQAAVNEADDNNTINVLGGTYASFGTSFGGASGLTIQTVDGAVIDGTTRPGNNRIVDLRANGTTFTGFTITSDGGGVGIAVPGQNVMASNNTITNVLTGIQTNTGSGNGTFTGNTITADYGISLQSAGNTVTGNTVNAAVEGMGVLAFANSVSGNTFNLGAGAAGLALYGGATASQIDTVDNIVSISGGTALQGAADLAGEDGTLNVGAGTYAGGAQLNNAGLTMTASAGALINVANGQNGLDVRADDITISGFEIVGPVVGDWRTVDWNDASVSYSIGINISHSRSGIVITNNNIHDIRTGINVANNSDASITNNRIENTKGGVLVRPASITALSGNTEGPLGNEWGVVLNLQNIDDAATADASRQAFLLGLSQANDGMAVFDRGYGFKNRTHIFVDDDTPIATAADDFGYGNGLGNERQELPSIQAAFNSVVNGGFVQVAGGTYTGTAATNDLVHLTTTGTANIGGLTLNGAGTTIAGTYSANGAGFSFGTPIVLTGNLSLTTTGAAAITTGTINGTAAGAQTLTVNAAGPVSMGSLGAATRLGTTTIGGAGAKTLTGSTYNANSLTFSGPVTLTQALTTFNSTQSGSAAGNITFNGNIFGTANGAQSVNFIAGNGAGAKSSNGDVTIQNAGTQAVKLGNMTVNSDDFSAKTIWLAADYNATMTGNQVFSSQTLNAGGNVNSQVGGNASGPVNSGGNVNMGAGGNVSGNISGGNVTVSGSNVNSNITATNNANVTAQNTYTGSVNANSGTINASTVDADVSGGSFTVNANSGSVTGSGNVTSGGGAITVNGQKQSGGVEGEFGQIIVEGFVLPEGAIVTEGGDIVLPQGLAIGLISPAAGEGATEPKVIFVRSVQRLGALLADGYSAIIIDLDSGFSDEEQEMAMTRSDIQDLGRN